MNAAQTSPKMSRIFTFILALIVLCCIKAETKIKGNTKEDEDAIVTTPTGKLKGVVEKDVDGNEYYSFMSIPYAKPPIGDLRFEDPQPVAKWGEDVRDALEDLPKCAQLGLNDEISGDEDCLYLSVFTPELPNDDTPLKQVMVFIHGGGFKDGSGGLTWYSPDFLMPEDVVLVTINYRLGIFGFLSLKDETTKSIGNAGLKDQVMALEWVRDNIKAFGGSSANVTIFGESAGAACVHYHVLSTKSKGLFTKAIMQSGTALNPWVNGLDNNGIELAKVLKINTDDHQKMLLELKSLTHVDVLKGQIKLKKELNNIWGEPASPTIENTHISAFISKDPYEIIASAAYHNVTLMIGYNDAEGISKDQLMRALYNESRLTTDFYEMIPPDLEIKANSSIAKTLAKDIKTFYYKDTEPSTKDMLPYIEMHTDVSFAYPAYRTAVEHAKKSTEPIYFYRFSADTELNVYKGRDPISKAYKGASHCDELGYLFKTDSTEPFDDTTKEYKAMKRMVKLWTSFAKDGKPSGDEGLDWLEFTQKDFNYLDFSTDKSTMKIDPDKTRMDFWNQQYAKYFNSYAVGVRSSPILVFMYILFNLMY